jgi:TonB family protein
MNRLHKKCIIVSAAFHLSLLILVLVGPAFLSAKNPVNDMPILDFIPSKLIDAAHMGGGNPNARPPQPTPQPPRPQPTPPAPRPEPPKPVVKPVEPPKPVAKDPVEPVRKKPEISKTLVTRTPETKPATRPQPDTRTQELAEARRAADKVNQTLRSLRDNLSTSTTVETNFGPGGGGEAYANYAQIVRSVYTQAWIAPDDSASDDAIVKVTVTIEHTGNVLSARIIKPSGDSLVDKSVLRTIERVTFVARFPEGTKDKQRTYTINFNLKAKRLLG